MLNKQPFSQLQNFVQYSSRPTFFDFETFIRPRKHISQTPMQLTIVRQ